MNEWSTILFKSKSPPFFWFNESLQKVALFTECVVNGLIHATAALQVVRYAAAMRREISFERKWSNI